jgi:hypothetical protein
MPDSRPLRPLRLLRLALVFAPPFGAVFACGVSEVVDPTTEDGGATDDAALVTAAACPATVVAGASCGAPEGTTCAADACGYGYFVCAKRVWVAFRGGASFRCPAVPPAEGELCSCVPKGADCTYGCGASGDAGGDGSGEGRDAASAGPQTAVCFLGAWRLGPALCGTDAASATP